MLIPLLKSIKKHLDTLNLDQASGHTHIAQWSVGKKTDFYLNTKIAEAASAHTQVALQSCAQYLDAFKSCKTDLNQKLPPLRHEDSSFTVNAVLSPHNTILFTFSTNFLPLKAQKGNKIEFIEKEILRHSARLTRLPWTDTMRLYIVEGRIYPGSNPACAIGTWMNSEDEGRLNSILETGEDKAWAPEPTCSLYIPQATIKDFIESVAP